MRSKIERLVEVAERVSAQHDRQEEAKAKSRAAAADVLTNAVERPKSVWPKISKKIVTSEKSSIFSFDGSEAVRSHYTEKGILVLGRGPQQGVGKDLKLGFSGTDLYVTESAKFLLLEYAGKVNGNNQEWRATERILAPLQVIQKFGDDAVETIPDALLRVVESHDASGARDRRAKEHEQWAKFLGGLVDVIAQGVASRKARK